MQGLSLFYKHRPCPLQMHTGAATALPVEGLGRMRAVSSSDMMDWEVGLLMLLC